MVLSGSYTNIKDVPAPDLSAVDAEYQHKDPAAGETVATLHTSFGDISIRFFPEAAPVAVNNFIALAKAEKFNDTIFHRVIGSFMIQGGDYTEFNGYGGESIYGDEFDLEVTEYLSNIEGSVAMANRGPGTNGSQFYINQVDNTYLDGKYTVFAQVFDGMDVVNDIAQVDTDRYDKPLNDVVLESVEVYEYE
ncbi:MAG: peptidylprolyl isomerase [Ruminococcus sp.]|nr:peptidylprolyl isomerase [Ruminococcus sp.]